MFLPALLVRDYGPWSFAAFAIPNCIGAAAMGFVLSRRGTSERLVQSHGWACVWFSLVTIQFQCFFEGWILNWFPLYWIPVAVAVWLLWPAMSRSDARRRGDVLRTSVVTMAVTVIAITVCEWSGPGFEIPQHTGSVNTPTLLLAPVCMFGFVLCPYLDLTFHKARQRLDGTPGTAAFLIGFGLLFVLPILFTLSYSGLLSTEPGRAVARTIGAIPLVILGVHILAQLTFTSEQHSQELRQAAATMSLGLSGRPGYLVVAFVAPFTIGVLAPQFPAYHGLEAAEIIYRLFMSFYGLYFPAYVWICMIPTWRSPERPSRRQWTTWATSCALATPAFWMGFVERREWWLVPGLAVILLARFFVGPVRKAAPSLAAP